MTIREYAIAIAHDLDENFLPDERDEIAENLKEILFTDVFDYYDRNIAPEMAAEFIAHKLGLLRDKRSAN